MMPFTRQGLGLRSVSKCFKQIKQCLTECAEHIPKRSKKLSLKWCQQWLLGSGGGGTCICERCGGATFPPTALIWPGVPDVGCLALKMSKKSVGGETCFKCWGCTFCLGLSSFPGWGCAAGVLSRLARTKFAMLIARSVSWSPLQPTHLGIFVDRSWQPVRFGQPESTIGMKPSWWSNSDDWIWSNMAKSSSHKAPFKDLAGRPRNVAAPGGVHVGVGWVRWWLRWLGALAVYHVLLAFIVQPLVLPKDSTFEDGVCNVWNHLKPCLWKFGLRWTCEFGVDGLRWTSTTSDGSCPLAAH